MGLHKKKISMTKRSLHEEIIYKNFCINKCKHCIFFQIADRKIECTLGDNPVEECDLIVKELNLLP